MEDLNQSLLPDLSQAVAEGPEYSFTRPEQDYTSAQEIVNFIKSRTSTVNAAEVIPQDFSSVLHDSMEHYLSYPAISSGMCKEILKSPLHFYIKANEPLEEKSKKHFELGTFAHKAFLEPELFDKVKIEPKENLATLEGCKRLIKYYEALIMKPINPALEVMKIADLKEYLQDLRQECPYEMIEEEHFLTIQLMKRNYYRYGNGIIPALLEGAKAECSFYHTDEESGQKLKVRPDAFQVEENIGCNAIISFKTSRADSLQKFLYDCAALQYEVSEGMYQEVISAVTGRKFYTTIMVMLQTCPPYLPAVFVWQPNDIENGIYKWRTALSMISECKALNSWPGFDAMAEEGLRGLLQLNLPEWSQKLIHPVNMED